MALQSDLKLAMRISHSLLDNDIQKNIEAAFEDMARVGIANCTEDAASTLQKQCVELYVKYIYDYEGKGERWFEHYERLRNQLSLSIISPSATPSEIEYAGANLTFKMNHYITGLTVGETPTDLTKDSDFGFDYPYLTIYKSYLDTLTETTEITYTTLWGDGTIQIIVGD